MTEDRPLVSVLMPTYNGARYIEETIESVLAQTYRPIEVVVVDDASTDSTAELVEGYVSRNPELIRLVRKQERAGPCRRRNDALDASRGSILAWLDQDDLWLPEKTERQVEVLRRRPDAGLVYTGYEAFDSETGRVLDWREEHLEVDGDVLAPLFIEGCFIASLTAVFRREVLTRRGLRLRDSDFSFGDDYFLWLVLSLDWQVVKLPQVLARYRRHADNESARIGQTNFHLRRIALLEEFAAAFPEARAKLGADRRRGLANHYVNAAFFELAHGRHRLPAARYALRALLLDPGRVVERVRSR